MLRWEQLRPSLEGPENSSEASGTRIGPAAIKLHRCTLGGTVACAARSEHGCSCNKEGPALAAAAAGAAASMRGRRPHRDGHTLRRECGTQGRAETPIAAPLPMRAGRAPVRRAVRDRSICDNAASCSLVAAFARRGGPTCCRPRTRHRLCARSAPSRRGGGKWRASTRRHPRPRSPTGPRR